jgi:hypothetical protein
LEKVDTGFSLQEFGFFHITSETKRVTRRATMRRLLILSTVAAAVVLINTAWADDFNAPDWRGDPRTTYQRWEFGTSSTTPAPDDYTNTLGVPTLTVTGEFPYTAHQASYEGATGVWKFEDYIQIEIANFNEEYDLKRIWIQLTYLAATGTAPLILTEPTYSERNIVEGPTPSGNYYHIAYEILIEPNPTSETIYIQPADCTLYLDEVVIDTICIPEPATICLLGFGALALLRKRRG